MAVLTSRDLLSIPVETWIILLSPTAVLAAIALIRRNWVWGYTVPFSLAYMALSIAIDYWDVYVAGNTDEKFQGTPSFRLKSVSLQQVCFPPFAEVLS